MTDATARNRFAPGAPARRATAWISLGLALVLLLAGSLTVWVERQALDTDNWVETSSRLLQDPDVRDRTAAELVDALVAGPELEERVRDLLPPDLRGLAGPATGLLRRAALPAAQELLSRPATVALWEDANRLAHRRLIALLDGDDEGILVATDGAVVLDLRPLVERLGDRLGIEPDLSGERGQVVLLRSDQIGAAQDAVKAIRALSVLILIAVLALLALAVWLATGFRHTMLVAVGAGAAAIGLVLLVVRRVVGDALVDALTRPQGRDAGEAVWLIGTDLLRDVAVGLLVYGLILLAGTWLASDAGPAVAARRRLAPAMRDHAVWVYAIVVVVFLILLAAGPASGDRRLAGVLVLAGLVALGVWALRRQILSEHPRPRGEAQ